MSTVPMAITMGDPSGVGPEIVLRRAAEGALLDGDTVVYGDLDILENGCRLLDLTLPIAAVDAPSDGRPGRLNVVDAGLLGAGDHRPGQLDAAAGAAARAYVAAATDAALAGSVAGIASRCRSTRRRRSSPIRRSSVTPSSSQPGVALHR
jgi:4-hydroxythreonine-4-phosphate dehydrogenase